MSKKKTAQYKKKSKSMNHSAKQHASSSSVAPWQIAVVAGVVLLIAGVLWLKNRPAASESAAVGPPVLVTSTGEGLATAPEPLAMAAADTEATPAATAAATDLMPRADESPEAHLDRLLAEGQPIFAFFHSDTCYQCTEMDKIVQQVHPEFAGQVALVDVNVYDEANQALLQRAGIRVIPTLIFIDQAGQGEVTTGVMPAEQLQAKLTALAAREMP